MRWIGPIALAATIITLPLVHREITRRRQANAQSTVHADAGATRPIDRDVARIPSGQNLAVVCTTDADCRGIGFPGAHCFTPSLAAQYTQAFHDCAAGSSWRGQHEPGTCLFDECRPDDAPAGDTCGEGLRCGTLDMVPFPQRVCVPASCRSDFDCRRHPGGRCASFFNAGRCLPGGWACSYPGDPCGPRDPHRMCPVVPGMLNYCAPRNGRFSCVQDTAIVEPSPSPMPAVVDP